MTVLLVAGGLAGLPYVLIVAELSLGTLSVCFGAASCPSPLALLLGLYWGLIALAMVTAGFSIVTGFTLPQSPQHHRTIGGTNIGLSTATLVALWVVLRGGVWLVFAFLGGWGLFLIQIGGFLAVLWRPATQAHVPAGAVD